MRLQRYWALGLVFIFLFVAFLFRGIAVPDPDFGWHLRAGQEILQHGIYTTDQFSYSMPSYPFVDHEWFTNLIWAITYNNFGLQLLLVVSSLLALGSVVLQTLIVKKRWVSILIFLAGGTMFEFVGIRAQVITWFLLSVLLCVLFEKNLWQRFRFFLPLLFLFWANLHGGFGIGLGVLGIVLLGRSWEEKKFVKEKLSILSLCIFATLLNPFGSNLWWEFWMQLSDTQLRWAIAEWYPAFYFTNIAFWIYFSLSTFLVIRYRKHFTKTELFLYVFLLIEGLASMRNIPIWVIASFFLTMRGVMLLVQEAAKHPYGNHRFAIAYRGFFVIAIGVFLPQVAAFFYGTFGLKENQHHYPQEAVIYLNQHIPKEQIFTTYDWGGYLDWHLPQKKVFIDGRMPSWRWNENKKGESNYAFEEYKNVMIGKTSFAVFSQKYHINTLLVPKNELSSPTMKLFGITIEKNSWMRKIFFSEFSFYKIVQQAKKDGWREVYRDDAAVIFQKSL